MILLLSLQSSSNRAELLSESTVFSTGDDLEQFFSTPGRYSSAFVISDVRLCRTPNNEARKRLLKNGSTYRRFSFRRITIWPRAEVKDHNIKLDCHRYLHLWTL